jgi:hypothetical protein
MIASDGAHRVALTPPDPALQNVELAKVTPFQWTMPDGRVVKGGLILPTVKSKTPPPLVLAPYVFEPESFNPDGPGDSYAAQTLAARGFAVLTYNTPFVNGDVRVGTPAELPDFTAESDAAVEALAAKGLIDPNRVGMVGFSRAGYAASYAITHPGKVHYSAVRLDDSHPGTYAYALTTSDMHEHNYGGKFWTNKGDWLKEEPSFNVDRNTAPVLRTYHGVRSELFELELNGAFKLTRRPQDTITFTSQSHALVTPIARFVSINLTVDWMRFWILGEEDPDPAKKLQYLRWRQMRTDWKRQQAWEAAGHPATSRPDDSFMPEGATLTSQ